MQVPRFSLVAFILMAKATMGFQSLLLPATSKGGAGVRTISKRFMAVDGNDDAPDSWQAKLETLLDPLTPLAQRQILLSELLGANQEIRNSVQAALRDRKIDPLLTPTGKKLQDGTRAVARQITNDILPEILSAPPTQKLPDLELVPKIGSKVLGALSNQAKRTLDNLQGDLADPSRIPQRITRQTEDFVQEAKNVFLETPEGLEGPSYTVVSSGKCYEIRDYQGYTVASTTMSKAWGEPPQSTTDLASGGAAFNALAAYIFGANSEGSAMEMTTPVTTTSLGEMRFFLKKKPSLSSGDSEDGSSTSKDFPTPIQQESDYETGAVQLLDIPPARLAVKKFTGFVTEGEIARQKEVLLQELELDGRELDIDHGTAIPHMIFQYNPPYTIPIVRRNEIAVPIRRNVEVAPNIKEEWGDHEKNNNLSPSDVE